VSIAFSRSLRSLESDQYRFSLVWLIIAIVLLGSWSIWFFTAKIGVYETTRTFEVSRDGYLKATFSEKSLKKILPGQKATFKPDGTPARPSIKGEVMNIPQTSNRQDGQVEIYLNTSENIKNGITGEIQVEVEKITPAGLVLRSTGHNAGGTYEPAGLQME